MTALLHRRLAATATLLLLASLPLLAAPNAAAPAAPAREMGDQWEVTSQMSMEGMPMALPSNTTKVCAPREWNQPPMAADERHRCTNSDFKKEGTKVSWKTVCAGPPEMTGLGEITRTGDSYTGSIKLSSSNGNMTTKLSGKRLGDCELPAK